MSDSGKVPRRLFISVDMEGIAGIASISQLMPGQFEYETARKWMTAEVAAAAAAALESGYDEVLIADGHGNAQNVLPDQLPPRTTLIRSWPRPLGQMQGADWPGVEACMFIGFHSGARSGAGTLAHTFNGSLFADVRLNGRSCSEAYLLGAFAGELGIPVTMISGDNAICDEVAALIPGIVTCPVKTFIGWRSVATMTPGEGVAAVRAAASRAVQQDPPPPLTLPGPYRLEIEFTHPVTAELAGLLPGFTQTGQATAAAEFATLRSLIEMVGFLGSYPRGD
jgi:D-amino peptidase